MSNDDSSAADRGSGLSDQLGLPDKNLAAVDAIRGARARNLAMRNLAKTRGQELHRLQARIDALMLEYCPDEMTPEQLTNWAAHQRPCSEADHAAVSAAMRA